MKLLNDLVDRVLDRVLPVVEHKVDELMPVVERKIDDLQAKALALLAAELPKMAATVAESAVKTVFDHTNIDEAANEVTDVFTGILDRLGLGKQ